MGLDKKHDATHDFDDSDDDVDADDYETLAKVTVTNKYGFRVVMPTEDYQDLYNQKWEEAEVKGIPCEKFDAAFDRKDNRYMNRKEKKQYNKKVNKKGWSEEKFDRYWMRIMQDRTVCRNSIERCFNDDDNQNDDQDNNDTDDNTDPNVQCSTDASSFIWGDDVVVPIKNQGQCGSCYAFSAMTVLEGAVAIQTGQQAQSLAEQQIVDCQQNYTWCYGCSGGWPHKLHESTR